MDQYTEPYYTIGQKGFALGTDKWDDKNLENLQARQYDWKAENLDKAIFGLTKSKRN